MSSEDNPTVQPTSSLWKRRCLRALIVFVGIPYLTIFAGMSACQRLLIYHPTKTGRLSAQCFSEADVDVEDVAVSAEDGLTLHAWHFHAEAMPDADSRLLVIYFPGNAGCRSDRISDCREFTRLGCDVLLVDYRGYGDNSGSPNEASFASDAARVWLFATEELHFPHRRIVIFGESLGGAMATRLAAEKSAENAPPKALILNSTFASLAEVVAWHQPAFPFQYALLDRFPSIDRIGQVTCPVLQFHGTADDIVPFQQGRRLFDAAPAKSTSGVEKHFVEIPGGQHNFISMSDMQVAVMRVLGRRCRT